jgi:hypothetical protein
MVTSFVIRVSFRLTRFGGSFCLRFTTVQLQGTPRVESVNCIRGRFGASFIVHSNGISPQKPRWRRRLVKEIRHGDLFAKRDTYFVDFFFSAVFRRMNLRHVGRPSMSRVIRPNLFVAELGGGCTVRHRHFSFTSRFRRLTLVDFGRR